MSDTILSRDDVLAAVATCRQAHRRPGLRPVWRAIVERTGKRPSFSTVSRLLAEVQAIAPPTPPTVPPDQVVAQVQQLAPAMWQAALAAARQELAAEMQRQQEQAAAAAERERELLAELDEAQARQAAAEAERTAAERRAEALQERLAAQTAAVQELAAAQQEDASRRDAREREQAARAAQLERETAELAGDARRSREDAAAATAAQARLTGELAEARRRADADLALNAHLREQLAVREEDLSALATRLAEALDRERQAQIALAAAERLQRTGGPLLRELRQGLARIERTVRPVR